MFKKISVSIMRWLSFETIVAIKKEGHNEVSVKNINRDYPLVRPGVDRLCESNRNAAAR
jgi:hypothetical protein